MYNILDYLRMLEHENNALTTLNLFLTTKFHDTYIVLRQMFDYDHCNDTPILRKYQANNM